MDEKRSNSALWKLVIDENEDSSMAKTKVLEYYKALSKMDRDTHPPLRRLGVVQKLDNTELDLYIRSRASWTVFPFLSPYLANRSDKKLFHSHSVDTCLFITIKNSLFAVTSGSGYNIVQDHADYSFPFDVARKLITNNFKATEVRSIAGATTSRTETYRRGQSIGNSDSFGKIWKRLVSRLNTRLLPDDSYILKLINSAQPPAVEVKSSFVLKKSLDLQQLISIAKELDELPEPTEEQRRQLSFLDNLYQVKSKVVVSELNRKLVYSIRDALTNGSNNLDLDVCDPDDVSRYYAGSNFKLSYRPIDGDPPDSFNVLAALDPIFGETVDNPTEFYERFCSLSLSYTVNADGDSAVVRKELLKFLHGQVDYDGQPYFRLDKVWYRIQGDFLQNLKRDFVEEVFNSERPILISKDELSFINWRRMDEAEFNKKQASLDGYYHGDKIFAVSNLGKVELFDLLRVDEERKTLFVVHVKDGFDAKMRDACSQISMSAEVINQDILGKRETLRSYYRQWCENPINRIKKIDESTFLDWFDLPIVYVVLVSTKTPFAPSTFQRDILKSHIARREILATRNEFRSNDNTFRLAHTRRS